MIFHISHVTENSINSIYYEILNKTLQHVKLLKLSFTKLCFKKKNFVIFIHNLNIIKKLYNKTQLIITYMHLKLIINKIFKDSHNELKQCLF